MMEKKKAFFDFNEKLIETAIAIREHLAKLGYEANLYQYDFEEQKGTITTSTNDNHANYYWLEFASKETREENGIKFKVSLFDKDFDGVTGYVHVLPGYIQIWKNDPTKAKENSLSSVCKKEISEIVRFAEGNWDPMICKKNQYYSAFDFESDDIIMDLIDSVIDGDKKKPLPTSTRYVKYLEKENLFRGSFKKVNNRPNRYAFMNWYQEKGRDCFWTPYNTSFDKDGFCWTKYGEVQFWSHEIKFKQRNTTNRWDEDNKWTLHYPQTGNRGIGTSEENSIQSILADAKDSERHEYSPGLDIHNDSSGKIIEEFNCFESKYHKRK